MTTAVVMCIEPITSLLDADVSRLSGPDRSDSTVKTATGSTKAAVAYGRRRGEPAHAGQQQRRECHTCDRGRDHRSDRQPGGLAAARRRHDERHARRPRQPVDRQVDGHRHQGRQRGPADLAVQGRPVGGRVAVDWPILADPGQAPFRPCREVEPERGHNRSLRSDFGVGRAVDRRSPRR